MRTLPVILMLVIAGAAAASADETRIGIEFLGTGFLSLTIERRFDDDNALRLTAGVFEMSEICTVVTVNRYFGAGDTRLHAGAGLFNVWIAPEGKIGRLDILTVPVGVDMAFSDRHAVDIECVANRFMGGRNPGGGRVTFNKRGLILPGITYRYRL